MASGIIPSPPKNPSLYQLILAKLLNGGASAEEEEFRIQESEFRIENEGLFWEFRGIRA